MNKKLIALVCTAFVCLIVSNSMLAQKNCPDLIIKSLSINTKAPTTSESISILAVVQNAGIVTCPASILSIKCGGESKPETYEIPPLKYKQIFKVIRKQQFNKPLRYRVTAVADSPKKIRECIEANNKKYIDFTVKKSCADLVVQRIHRTPVNPTTAEEITFTATVKNIGNATSRLCKLALKVGGESVPPQYSVPAMAAGATYPIQRKITLPHALRYLARATIDVDEVNSECDEDNNQKELIFTVIRD